MVRYGGGRVLCFSDRVAPLRFALQVLLWERLSLAIDPLFAALCTAPSRSDLAGGARLALFPDRAVHVRCVVFNCLFLPAHYAKQAVIAFAPVAAGISLLSRLLHRSGMIGAGNLLPEGDVLETPFLWALPWPCVTATVVCFISMPSAPGAGCSSTSCAAACSRVLSQTGSLSTCWHGRSCTRTSSCRIGSLLRTAVF